MAMKHLGESFDLHSGGIDLIFPHHENEIAQSEASTNKPFARHWFHIAHLMVDGVKMSKSLGNLYTLDDIKDRGYTAEELRYVLLTGSYRQVLNFTWDSLNAARKAISRFRDFQNKIGGTIESPIEQKQNLGVLAPVLEALQSDLNTADALGKLFTIMKSIHNDLDSGILSPHKIAEIREGFSQIMQIFGFTLSEPSPTKVPQDIERLAQQRWQAKANRDWETADRIRQELTDAGWAVKDDSESYQVTPLSLLPQ